MRTDLLDTAPPGSVVEISLTSLYTGTRTYAADDLLAAWTDVRTGQLHALAVYGTFDKLRALAVAALTQALVRAVVDRGLGVADIDLLAHQVAIEAISCAQEQTGVRGAASDFPFVQ